MRYGLRTVIATSCEEKSAGGSRSAGNYKMTLAIELGWEGAKAKEEINNMESLVDQSANVWNEMTGK